MEQALERIVGRLRVVLSAADELAAMPAAGANFLTRVGRAYTQVGAHDRAAEFFRRAVDSAPGDPNGHYNLGAALVFTGEFADAKRHLLRAVELEPRHFPAWYSLAAVERQTHVSNYIPQLEAQFAGPDPDGSRSLHIGHALAKTYEDLGQWETSFDWLLKAKAERGRRAGYSASGEQAAFRAAMAAFDTAKGPGFDSEEPVFVVGLPRTGTTLIDSILCAHPDVTSGGELGILPVLAKYFAGVAAETSVLDPAVFAGVAQTDMARFGRLYVEATRPVSGRTSRFVDKTTASILFAGIIAKALPKARIVCLRRDPMDSVVSYFRHMFFHWPHVYPSVYDLRHAAVHYALFHALADHWGRVLPPDRYHQVSYERLVADQEGETRKLLDFIGLPFDAACLDFHKQKRVVATASAVQVRQPVYGSAIGRWRRYGDRLAPAIEVLRATGVITDEAA